MMSLSEVAAALDAAFRGGDAVLGSVSTDTRSLEPGAVYVALRGPRFDGHAFIEQAAEAGAVGALVDQNAVAAGIDSSLPLVVVPDTRRALGVLARRWRERFTIPLIAVCGSNGKTTVKEMIAAILRARFGDEHVLATRGNLNNDVGLPLTLLGLREPHRAAVVEIGINHPGETALLADIARPTVGLINNAQREHQEFLHSVEEVAREHAALLEALPSDGVAVINADDEFAPLWMRSAGERACLTFGLNAGAQVTGRYRLEGLGSRLEISGAAQPIAVALATAGLHNVRNALAATAATTAAGIATAAIVQGLEAFRPVAGRLEPRRGRAGAWIIDDSYNANPDSVRAAIDVLTGMSPPRILVLGDMGEVGDQGAAFHAEIGRYAREAGLDAVMCVGSLAAATARAFGPRGEHFESRERLLEALGALPEGPSSLLVKGSRFMRMEQVVEALLGDPVH
jgi:UDP-N-acetylmuramoyl-tripeptide--D-alanyl-D-alanine ligase